MSERIVHVNGIDLCVEEFGERSHPALLLIAGAASSMDWWDVAFCERLAAGSLRVVRFDLRDTGRSTTFPPGAPPYPGSALIADVVELISALGLAPVHLLGLSMGGGIAQQIAIRHPELIATLILMSTSPDGPGGDGTLSPPTPALMASFSSPSPDWSHREAVQRYFVATERAFSGTIPVDEPRIREIAGAAFDRSSSLASADNHVMAGGDDDAATRAELASITAKTLVIHGSADPLFPLDHGEALAREIPGARLVVIDGMGHQNPPPPTWDVIVPAILEHTA
jgi:pimeloyl-ACP methyl ester carboxylesterase